MAPLELKVTIIYPATEKHISKYSTHARFLLEETADDYRSVTLPHLEQEQLSLEVSSSLSIIYSQADDLLVLLPPRVEWLLSECMPVR